MNKKIIFIIGGLCFISYVIFVFLTLRKAEQVLTIFISSRLDGRIVEVSGSSGGEKFRLNISVIKYNIFTNLSNLNNFTPFPEAAEIGDSVSKPAFSDTLTLIKKSGRIYKYTFKKSYKKS